MNNLICDKAFQSINKGYDRTFQANKLSIGLVVPLEVYRQTAVPSMEHQLSRIQLAERLGFAAVWLRDVPFHVPSFGDAGQIFDPFVYLGMLAGQTSEIALGVSSIVLPLRHPAHVAKAAASVDVLSGGRLMLGVASGDRIEEYPALNLPYENRGERFRDSIEYIKQSWGHYPVFENFYGRNDGSIDLLPKPLNTRVPLLITGSSQQAPSWLAENGDGWMIYPRAAQQQKQVIVDWRERIKNAGLFSKPVMQPLYIDLSDDPSEAPSPIHLGFRSGINYLKEYLVELEGIGVNHVALNLRFNQSCIDDTLSRLADKLLPMFT